MTWMDLFLVTAATGGLSLTWFHKGGLFENWRDWLDVWGEIVLVDNQEKPTWYQVFRNKVAFAANCSLCFPFHLAFWLTASYFAVSLLCPSGLSAWRLVTIPLAAGCLWRFGQVILELLEALILDENEG
jgi:hypothetical protein